MKAGLYARVSTEEQTLEQQLEELRRVAAARHYEPVEYIDHGLSGALPENMRPALGRMMADAKRGRIKVVMCWDVSRLGRSVPIVVELVERLRTSNVQFTTLCDNIDTTTPQGEFQFHVFAAMAHLHRKMIGQNTKAKLDLLRKQGVILGRPSISRRQKKAPVEPEKVRMWALGFDKIPTVRKTADKFSIGKSTAATILKPLSNKPPAKSRAIIVGRRA